MPFNPIPNGIRIPLLNNFDCKRAGLQKISETELNWRSRVCERRQRRARAEAAEGASKASKKRGQSLQKARAKPAKSAGYGSEKRGLRLPTASESLWKLCERGRLCHQAQVSSSFHLKVIKEEKKNQAPWIALLQNQKEFLFSKQYCFFFIIPGF